MQPVEFTAGLDVGSGGVKQPAGEGAGGLFSGASGPKPPPALSQAVIGMKPGGKVSHTATDIIQLCLTVMNGKCSQTILLRSVMCWILFSACVPQHSELS